MKDKIFTFQCFSFLGGGSGFIEMHHRATQSLHGCSERAAGAGGQLKEHGAQNFTLPQEQHRVQLLN